MSPQRVTTEIPIRCEEKVGEHFMHIYETSGDVNPLPPSDDGMLPEEKWSEIATLKKISPRELQVGRFVFAGMKDERIATELGLSAHTVRTYRRRFYGRFGVRTAREASNCIWRLAQYLVVVVWMRTFTQLVFLDSQAPTSIPF